MFHVKRSTCLVIVFLTFFSLTTTAQGHISLQDKEFIHDHVMKTEIQEALDTLKAYQSLSEIEKEAVYWINFVRLYPKQYNTEIVKPFLEQFPEVKSSYAQSLTEQLNNISPASLVLPVIKLNNIARKHAGDLGNTGHHISHNSSSGTSFQKRMNDGGIFSCISENIYEGKPRPLQTILFLLIDHGVPNLGHRKNILDKNMHSIGVAYHPIKGKKEMYYAVQNFYCGDPL